MALCRNRSKGWRFIPIWVGPQAPCTAYTIKISSDSEVARSQGQAEAQLALQAAYNLGLLGGDRQSVSLCPNAWRRASCLPLTCLTPGVGLSPIRSKWPLCLKG